MQKVLMGHRRALGPRLQVDVTAELIETSIVAHSSHCMIAEAIRAAYPTATHVSVDIATCRFSDVDKGQRYVYLTPRTAQRCIIDFDEGHRPTPFSFLLRNAHVTRAGHANRDDAARAIDREKQRERRAREKDVPIPTRQTFAVSTKSERELPVRLGGKRPPQLHIRREFGLRAFRARQDALSKPTTE